MVKFLSNGILKLFVLERKGEWLVGIDLGVGGRYQVFKGRERERERIWIGKKFEERERERMKGDGNGG